MKHDVHVYPIFRVKLKDLQGTPIEMVEAAETAVGTALNGGSPMLKPNGVPYVSVFGQEEGTAELHFADGFDMALVDVTDDKGRRLESFTVNPQRDQALKHVETLDSLIGGQPATLGGVLAPIKAFLEMIR